MGMWWIRNELAALAFFGFFNVYAMRVNLSVAAVKMANQYHWTKPQEGIVLGSFFYGYITTQVLGGWLSTKFGGKWVFGVGVLVTAVLTIATPWVAHNLPLLVVVRVLEGIGEGVTFPAMHGVWARWAPPSERTKLTTLSYSGASMGTIISMPLSGYICGSSWGWPAVFYLCGMVGVVWFVLWTCLMHSDPRTHPRITEEEKRYIIDGIEHEKHGAQNGGLDAPLLKSGAADPRPPTGATPWLKIFTSVPVWAIIFGHVSNNWGFYNLLTCLPSYLHNVLGLDIAHAGFLSGLPYLCLFIVSNVWSPLVDRWRRTPGCGSTTFWRKFSQVLGQVIAAGALIMCGYPPKDEEEPSNSAMNHTSGSGTFGSGVSDDVGGATSLLSAAAATAGTKGSHLYVICLLCIAVGASGFPFAGFNVNHLDIAPKYAGVLMGITNTAATIPGFLAPMLTDDITTADPITEKEKLLSQWRTVFYIAAGVYAVGSFFFLIGASGVKQSWALGAGERPGSLQVDRKW